MKDLEKKMVTRLTCCPLRSEVTRLRNEVRELREKLADALKVQVADVIEKEEEAQKRRHYFPELSYYLKALTGQHWFNPNSDRPSIPNMILSFVCGFTMISTSSARPASLTS
jgi:hypothetical protein